MMGEQRGKAELIAEHKSEQGPQVLQIRGSLIVSSLQTLRELSLFDRYMQKLPPERRNEVVFVLASTWVPVELAMVHYAACDALHLGEEELGTIGKHVSNRIMTTFVGTLVRSTRTVAAPGQVPLKQYPRLWDRLMVGGSCRVTATGMKDARIESLGVPMFRYRYFRIAYMALVRGAGLLFRSAVYTKQRHASEDALTIDVSWV